jgi:hypothetical protein
MNSVLNCRNVVKHSEFYLGWLRLNATSTGNAGCFKKSFTITGIVYLVMFQPFLIPHTKMAKKDAPPQADRCFLDLSTGWRWVVSFMSRPF